MRINVYTEELISAEHVLRTGEPAIEVVTAEYVSSRTGQPMVNYGLRIYCKSHPDLHYIPGRDDDRSAITFWCGSAGSLRSFAENLYRFTQTENLERAKTEERQKQAEAEMPLSFEYLRNANLQRCVTDFKHPLNMWSVAEWGAATAGEVGEACNVAKKLIRIRDGMAKLNNVEEKVLKQQLADEIADFVIYADLWAASQGINLAQAIIEKFNRDSAKHNARTLL